MSKSLFLINNYFIAGDWIMDPKDLKKCKYTRGWSIFHPLKKILKHINETSNINVFTNNTYVREWLKSANKLNYKNEPNKKEFLDALNRLEKYVLKRSRRAFERWQDEMYELNN